MNSNGAVQWRYAPHPMKGNGLRLFAFLGGLFLLIPLIEIALFIAIGGEIGALATIAIVIATGIIGATVISRQGLSVIETVKSDLSEDRLPVIPVIEGVMLIGAALLLITPGFATDTIGFALAVPPVRRWLAQFAQKHVQVAVVGDNQGGHRRPYGGAHEHSGRGPVIEGEVIRETPDASSPWKA